LGQTIVDTFFDFYQEQGIDSVTLSVLDLSKLKTLSDDLNTWAQLVNTALDKNNELAWEVARSRSASENYGRVGRFDYGMVDLIDFVRSVQSSLSNSLQNQMPDVNRAMIEATAKVVDTATSIVTYKRSSKDREASNGVSVFMPNVFHILDEENHKMVEKQVEPIEMGAAWKAFLTKYTGLIAATPKPLEIKNPTVNDKTYSAELVGNVTSGNNFEFGLFKVNPEGRVLVLQSYSINDEDGIGLNNGKVSYELSTDGVFMVENQPAFFYFLREDQGDELYAIPIQINGKEADMVLRSITFGGNSLYRVDGYTMVEDENGNVYEFKKGDRLALSYPSPRGAQKDKEEGLDYLTAYPTIVLQDAKPDLAYRPLPVGQYQVGFYFFDTENQMVLGEKNLPLVVK
jgi:hypothetical protein